MTGTEYYTVKEGKAEKFESIGSDRVAPTGQDVLVIPGTMFSKARRIAIYPANSPKPFPLSDPIKVEPDSLSVADLQNLQGPYISGLVKRALGLEDGEFKTKDWIMLAITGTTLVLNGAGLYLVVELARRFNVI